MAPDFDVDPALVDRALELSDERTSSAVVALALGEFIARREQPKLWGLAGAAEWDEGFDYKSERSRA